ncbi:reverse transcriptase domain-containing protein [Tanacetum coccineum]
MPREGLAIIESKSKVRYSRSRPNDSRAITNAPSSTSSPSNNSFEIQQMAALLEDKMNIRMSRLEKAISEKNAMTPAISKAVEEFVSHVVSNHNSLHCPLPVVSNPQKEPEQNPETSTEKVQNPNLENTAHVPPPEEEESIFMEIPKPKAKKTVNVEIQDLNSPRPNSYQSKLPYPERMKVRENDKPSAQHSRFLKMFKQLRLEIGLKDALVEMPKFNKWLSSLLRNKEKLEEIAITTVNAECSAIIMNKVPEKLEDPGKFLIPSLNSNSNEHSILPNLQPVGKFTYPADFVVVDYAPDEQIPLILGRPFLRTARALIDVYDEKLILRDGNESLTLNMQSEKSKLNGIQRVESINMIDIFNVPNYIGFKDLFAQMYSGSPTIQSDDSFPSSSPMKTSDSTFEEFTDEFTLPNSLPPGDDVSILKKDFQEDTFRIISNPLFEFDDSFKSSNVNPLFEENDKDVEIKSSSSFTLTSPEESELEAYLEKNSIPPGIDLTLPPTFEFSSSNPTSPTLTGGKDRSKKMSMFFSLIRFIWRMMYRVLIRRKILCLLATYLHKKPKPPQEVQKVEMKDNEVSSEIPINTIVMPIRITFDNPIDFNDHFSKPKDLKKDLTISFDSTTTSTLPHPLLDSNSPFTTKLSASVTLNSLGNEDKVFKPGILVYHAIHDKNLVTLEEKFKENISSGTLLVFKEPSFLLPPPEPPDECCA